jgi:hypothetical protein
MVVEVQAPQFEVGNLPLLSQDIWSMSKKS